MLGCPTYFYQEQPSPTSSTTHTTHVEQAVCQERREDVGDAVPRPEVSEADGELGMLVEVGQVEDDLVFCERALIKYMLTHASNQVSSSS